MLVGICCNYGRSLSVFGPIILGMLWHVPHPRSSLVRRTVCECPVAALSGSLQSLPGSRPTSISFLPCPRRSICTG